MRLREPGERVYRTSTADRRWIYAPAAIAAAFGLAFIGFAARGRSPFAGILLWLGCIASAAFVTALFRSYAVILRDESIEVVSLLRRRTFHRFELRGRRARWGGLAFVVGDEIVRVAAVTNVAADERLADWVNGLPDLDALDLEEREEKLLAHDGLGVDREARRQAFESARSVGRALTLVTGALAACAFVYPRAAVVIALLSAPPLLVALTLASRGLFALGEPRDRLTTSLFSAWVIPVGVSGLIAHRVPQLDAWPTHAAVVIGALCAVAWILGAVARSRWRSAAAAALVVTFHLFSAVSLANELFDHRAPEERRATVVDKRYVAGRDPYRVRVAGSDDEIVVSAAVFHGLEVGQPLCVDVHRGAFGIRWARYRLCDAR